MNTLPLATKSLTLRCLTDGMGIRATARTTGVSKGAVLRLLEDAGEFCAVFQDHILNDLPATRVEVDEIWSFVGAKEKNATTKGHGDLWTFCAIDADTKLVCTWLVGVRDQNSADYFVADLAQRVRNRIQLSSDGWGGYLYAVRKGFEMGRVDFGVILKTLGQTHEKGPGRRYSPPVVIGVEKKRMIGRPDMALVSTSYVERLNLSIRQHCKRFARLTSSHSRKAENHAHAVALNFFAHNFLRVHSVLTKTAGKKTTPAMAAGLVNRPWTVEDLLTLMDPKAVTVK